MTKPISIFAKFSPKLPQQIGYFMPFSRADGVETGCGANGGIFSSTNTTAGHIYKALIRFLYIRNPIGGITMQMAVMSNASVVLSSARPQFSFYAHSCEPELKSSHFLAINGRVEEYNAFRKFFSVHNNDQAL